VPSETWGMRRTRRFLPPMAMAWASARAKLLHTPGDCTSPGQPQPKE
jgi:hypothetical protein